MRVFLLLMTMLLAAPAQAQQTTPPQVLRAAVEQVIRPGVLEFKTRANGLSIAVNALCRVPSENALTMAKVQFRQAALAFGRIEFIRIGPLMENNRADRLLFWPDRRGVGLRQVQAVLADEDATATVLATLREKSVAVQGFGALEFVLYGTGAETLLSQDGAYRCAYGRAVAANIAQMASNIARDWFTPDGVADRLMAPEARFDDFRTDTEGLETLVGLVSHGVESMRDTRVRPFLGSGVGDAAPKSALFWRSGLTIAMLRANVDGMRGLVALSGMARAVAEANKGLDNSIDFEFRNAVRALDLVTLPVQDAVEEDSQVQALNYLVLVTGSLQAMLGEQLPAALGLSVGFSALDGD